MARATPAPEAVREAVPGAAPKTAPAPFDLAAAAPIGGVYVMLFLTRGIASPFFPLWFQDRGYSSAQISCFLAVSALAGLVLGPAVGLACNALAWRRTGLAVVAGLAAGGFALLSACACAGGGGWSLYVLPAVWVAAIAVSQVLLPLADVLAVNAARAARPHYGQYRGLGTAAYMAANLVGGGLIHALGSGLVVAWCVVASLGGVAAALALPDRDWNRCAPGRPSPAWTQVGALLRNRTFLAILLVAGLIECSHVYFYSFSSLIWRAEGAGPLWIGGLRAVCALAEAAFLFRLEPWTRRVDPWSLLLVGSAGSIVRWLAMGTAPPLWAEVGLQGLHALSYTATFIAALRLVERTLEPAQFPLGQCVCAAFIGGFVPGVGTLFCGVLDARFAAGGYFVMAAIAALAGIGALWFRRAGFRGGRSILRSAAPAQA